MPTLYCIQTNKQNYFTNNLPLTLQLVAARNETVKAVVRKLS